MKDPQLPYSNQTATFTTKTILPENANAVKFEVNEERKIKPYMSTMEAISSGLSTACSFWASSFSKL
jgi:hypothetical protein